MTDDGSQWQPFDYVEDARGMVYVVRAMAGPDRAIVRPTYRRRGGTWCKIDERDLTQATENEDASQVLALFDAECRCLAVECLRRVFDARSRPASGVYTPAPIARILDELSAEGVVVYAYGSRALGIESARSDWDFLVEGAFDPMIFLGRLSAVSTLRFLEASELSRLVARYRYPRAVIKPDDLMTVVQAGLPFFFANNQQVDLFRCAADMSTYPAITEPAVRADVEGVIQANDGDSFCMPRRVVLAERDRRIVVSHYAWLLCGIERLCGRRAVFSNLRVDAAGEYWFSPRDSRLELVGHAAAF